MEPSVAIRIIHQLLTIDKPKIIIIAFLGKFENKLEAATDNLLSNQGFMAILWPELRKVASTASTLEEPTKGD